MRWLADGYVLIGAVIWARTVCSASKLGVEFGDKSECDLRQR